MNFLFDMDGVLVDSKEAWYRSFQEIGNISREEFEDRFWGRDLQENMDELGADRKTFCDSVLVRYVEDVDPFPEAREVLSSLKGKKALITNTTSHCTAHILQSNKLDGYFDAIITSDEVENGKPDPALIYRAMEALDASPADTVVIGDSVQDMVAGGKAGCLTIGVGVQGDYTVSNIKEILEIAQKLEKKRQKKDQADIG